MQVCDVHIASSPASESVLRMHPLLRVTLCLKCYDFYIKGVFEKADDGSELYCRWCGHGGDVYCCSNCPYVFCDKCISRNLHKNAIIEIEQSENWKCFVCSPKIIWPLRSNYWAHENYIKIQKQ